MEGEKTQMGKGHSIREREMENSEEEKEEEEWSEMESKEEVDLFAFIQDATLMETDKTSQ